MRSSSSFTEALRKLGMRPAGGNHATLKKYVGRWNICVDHFDPYAASRELLTPFRAFPLEDVLVEHSNYDRGNLKRRLYAEGLRERRCELCAQGELWRGRRMALILDHINGAATDNRLENLRIICPNCAATLDTHCGRNRNRDCVGCGTAFHPNFQEQRYCSAACHARTRPGTPQPPRRDTPRNSRRKVERPPYEQLLAEIAATSYSAVGRRYGVSDNAIRKWVRRYERERAAESVKPGGAARRDRRDAA